MSRFFRRSERAILYIAAGGKCSQCREPLTDGWHADHVRPFSKGGETNLRNGQALCPTCNLAKGNKAMTTNLRQWQDRALTRAIRMFEEGKRDFLLAACPGAGKTTWALSLADELIKRGVIDLVVVVVPSDELRTQWANNTSTPLDLLDFRLRDIEVRKDGYNGIVTTYQALGGMTAGLIEKEANDRTLVILDEIHHAADASSYGLNLKNTFGEARFRVSMTGTPWRTNNREAIPFVDYDKISREVAVNFAYTYGAAVRDDVCRPIRFHIHDGEAKFRRPGDMDIRQVTMTADLDAKPDDVSTALNALLDFDGGWVAEVLKQANRELMSYREEHPDAGGLIIARDQAHAHGLSLALYGLTGHRAKVVVSDADDAKADIARFRKSSEPWIIAVRMIAEGVDIPRLMVGVYLTNYQTRMFFTQVVGRFVRKRPNEDVTATMFVPPTGAVAQYAREIETLSKYALQDRDEPPHDPRRRQEGPGEQPSTSPLVVLGTESLGMNNVIASGEHIDGAEVSRWSDLFSRAGIPVHHAAKMAALGESADVAPAAVAVLEPEEVDRRPRVEVERELRTKLKYGVNRVVRNWVHDEGDPHMYVNGVIRAKFGPRGSMSIAKLERAIDYVQRWNESGVKP